MVAHEKQLIQQMEESICSKLTSCSANRNFTYENLFVQQMEEIFYSTKVTSYSGNGRNLYSKVRTCSANGRNLFLKSNNSVSKWKESTVFLKSKVKTYLTT